MLVEERKNSLEDEEDEESSVDDDDEGFLEGDEERSFFFSSPFNRPFNYNLSSLKDGLPSFPTYLDLSNLNDRVVAAVNERVAASLQRLYEARPHFPAIPHSNVRQKVSDLYNTLIDEEYKDQEKREEFEKVRKEFVEQLQRQRRISSKNKERKSVEGGRCWSSQRSSGDDEKVRVEDDPLHDEFWAKAFEVKGSSSTSTTMANSSSFPRPPVNPFYSRLKLTTYDYIKVGLMFPVVILRVFGMTVFLILAIIFTYIGLAGLSVEETSSAPLAPWRRGIRWFCAHVLMRGFFFCASFQWITTKGTQASRDEAPILVVAPHSSYFDAFAVTQCGGTSVFAKDSTKSIPVFGKLIDFTQPIYVNRDDARSRQGSVSKLRDRVQSPLPFPQVFIFPEGTTTNRSCLAQFKPGAFLTKAPVQPVLIRFPNRLDCPTWSWDSPSFYYSFYYTLSQFTTWMTLEFLPVYTPSQEEQDNPSLYASNVQKVMASALGVPATDFSMEDGIALQKLNETKVRLKLERMWKIKGKLNMRASTTETTLLREGISSTAPRPPFNWDFTLERFMETIFPSRTVREEEEIAALFDLFKAERAEEETIDLRAYCFLDFIMFATTETSFEHIARLVFRTYVDGTTITREEFGKIMRNVFELKEADINGVFYGRRDPAEVSVISCQDFMDKIIRRVEYVKLFAMEATGQRSGNYPKRDERDREGHAHSD